jgi:hypothetical protein
MCGSLVWNRLHVTVIEPNICGSLVWNWLHVTVIEPNICVSFVWNWFHVMFIEPNICGSLVWNRLHIKLIEPNIWGPLIWNWLHMTIIQPNNCISLVWNWLHVTVIEPNICGCLLWNWLHITVLAHGVLMWLLHVTTDWSSWWGIVFTKSKNIRLIESMRFKCSSQLQLCITRNVFEISFSTSVSMNSSEIHYVQLCIINYKNNAPDVVPYRRGGANNSGVT